MTAMKILLVEDDDQDRKNCQDAVKDFNESQGHNSVEIVEAINLEVAIQKLDNTFDGAIIDLKLGEQGDEGNQVTKKIEESYFRIPVLILTGTPDAVDSAGAIIKVLKKGDTNTGYEDILKCFLGIYKTGLTQIMGGRGKIEKTLGKVFRQNLLPQKDKWITYGKIDSSRTEKALLRHTLSHLFQLLDDDAELFFPEEVYLTPPLTDKIRTGSVVKEKSGETKFVVMTPACDLVIRTNGKCNTDRILIVEIDLQTSLFPDHQSSTLSTKQKGDLKTAYKNNKSDYYHWLPRTDFFEGGFLNFRKLLSLPNAEFNERFEKPAVQISPSFVKDMVARFSAYYARQGQPDIDIEHFINPLAAQT